MQEQELIPHLFRTEYRKIISVLCKHFGMEHLEMAEDMVSDTFLLAAETWGLKGLPKNPTGWLYTVSKNKILDVLKHDKLFQQKIVPELMHDQTGITEKEIDWSVQNINDSQLQMMFAICHPCISAEAQIGLALNILCGFGVEEIADAFLSNKETIYKRLARAKEKLKSEKIKIELPAQKEINQRLETVLTTLYLLFSEGYYSTSQNTTLRQELCVEAMRLNLMLIQNQLTNIPSANALMSLMCFHSSRFDARINSNGEIVLYEDQDENLWNRELIQNGEYYLNQASTGKSLSKFHLEAAIAYWHTQKKETKEKWENILQLYNRLLQIEYSPMAALNRTYALSKANGKADAIKEAEKLNLSENHLYHSLLGNLYTDIDNTKAINHLQTALSLAKTSADKAVLASNIAALKTEIVK
ncbi:MAG: RNA polymerase subunit sigma [Bacteroidetes bacterium]|nr:RNA polymerase subunit sigma [Bacteroidota bacterium]MBP6403863.1 RNA polymerase subunit sigma [Bacteroidia bacterium]